MNSYVTLKRCGKFYQVYNEDVYVMYHLFGYKISKGRTGFPVNSLDKVLNEFERRK